MPDILSQAQIDALLKGIDSNDAPPKKEEQQTASGKKIREYDFKSPKKFTKEQLRTIESMYDGFTRHLSSYLSGALRLACESSVLQVEEQRYYEYNNALPDSTLLGMLDLKPDNENLEDMSMMMELSNSLGFSIIDRLLGGTGVENQISREFTEIELNIVRNVFAKITGYVQETWNSYVNVSVKLNDIETNPRLVQVFSPEDIVVIVLIEIKLKGTSGNMSVCIPALNLEELLSSFTSRYTRTAKKHVEEKEVSRKDSINRVLLDSELDIKYVFDEFSLDLYDVLRLQPNDIIPLSKSLNSDIILTIDDSPRFTASLGEYKRKKAVKINKILELEKKN